MNQTKMRPAIKQGKPLTEEEKQMKVAQFLTGKREAFAINILCALCKGGVATEDALVTSAVKMADQLIEALYPMPKEGE